MKKIDKILVLLTIAVLMVLSFIIIRNKKNVANNEEIDTVSSANSNIFSLGSDCSQVCWKYDGEENILDLDENGWRFHDDSSVSINSVYSDDILNAISTVKATRTIEAPSDLAEYGLDNPEIVITIISGDSTFTINVGIVSALSGERYVSIGDGNVYLTDSRIYQAFAHHKDELTAVIEGEGE